MKGNESVRGGGEGGRRDDTANCGEIKPVIPGQQWLDTRSKEGENRWMSGNIEIPGY